MANDYPFSARIEFACSRRQLTHRNVHGADKRCYRDFLCFAHIEQAEWLSIYQPALEFDWFNFTNNCHPD